MMLARGGIRLRLHRLSADAGACSAMVPGIIAGRVSQVSIFVSTIVASLEDGAASTL